MGTEDSEGHDGEEKRRGEHSENLTLLKECDEGMDGGEYERKMKLSLEESILKETSSTAPCRLNLEMGNTNEREREGEGARRRTEASGRVTGGQLGALRRW